MPVLREHGELITTVFYRQLFAEHPELLNIFNPANQHSGGQARSLAASILAYAANIHHLERLGGMVDQIAHKHVSLNVAPEHYPIVGKHLLGAIRTVLGDAATPEILDAWAAAYGQLANIMIGREEVLYVEGESKVGGWRGYKPFVVKRKQPESSAITSFYLAPADRGPLPPFAPGQFLGVKVRVPGSQFDQIRQYSLSTVDHSETYRISVKRESAPNPEDPNGQVSNYLHNDVHEGDQVLVQMPSGTFTLDEGSTDPVVLLSGGVGITPALCMLHALAKTRNRRVLFVHATLNGSTHAFKDEVKGIAANYPSLKTLFLYEKPQPADSYDLEGRITAQALVPYLPGGTPQFYYCGPLGFMNGVSDLLDWLAIPASRRFSEAFAPDPSFDLIIEREPFEAATAA